ncbi:MAG TPA: hypothetical protein VFV31_14045 [Chitinophagaceae bacterium]|nr:hypothetical protein [Chitinophagaceae bacterium]
MKHLFSNLIILVAVVFVSCKKETTVENPSPLPEVEMIYSNLNNLEIKYLKDAVVDINKDNRVDLLFEVLRVGDFVNKVDKFKFNILTSIYTSVPVNSIEQIPVMQKGAIVPVANFSGNEWYSASEINLFEKVLFENGAVQWRGNWLTVQKGFLPFQIRINNQRHNGWIEVTADQANERLVLHRAAYSKLPNKDVKAGF